MLELTEYCCKSSLLYEGQRPVALAGYALEARGIFEPTAQKCRMYKPLQTYPRSYAPGCGQQLVFQPASIIELCPLSFLSPFPFRRRKHPIWIVRGVRKIVFIKEPFHILNLFFAGFRNALGLARNFFEFRSCQFCFII